MPELLFYLQKVCNRHIIDSLPRIIYHQTFGEKIIKRHSTFQKENSMKQITKKLFVPFTTVKENEQVFLSLVKQSGKVLENRNS